MTIPQNKNKQKQKPLPRDVLHHSLNLACSLLNLGKRQQTLGSECEVLALGTGGVRDIHEDHKPLSFPIVRHCSEPPNHETVPEPILAQATM